MRYLAYGVENDCITAFIYEFVQVNAVDNTVFFLYINFHIFPQVAEFLAPT